MKVILVKDVAKIGRRGQVVVVPDGFALNKLIPRGMAQAATPENLKRHAHTTETLTKAREGEASAFAEVLKTLKDVEVSIEVETNPEGGMFQALKATTVAEAIAKVANVTIDTEHIIFETPIKSAGVHEVVLASGDSKGTVAITLISKSK
jgi:large subunit ribosomal protein L9